MYDAYFRGVIYLECFIRLAKRLHYWLDPTYCYIGKYVNPAHIEAT
jgi:hypothetical protein